MATEQTQPNGAGPAAPTAPETTPQPGGIESLVQFDPFTPPSEPSGQQPAGQGTGDGQPPDQQPPAGQAPAAPRVVTPEQFDELQRGMAEMRAWMGRFGQQQPQAQPQQGQQPQQRQPRYNVNFHPELVAALNHEDQNQRMAGTTWLVNSMAEMVHDTIMNDVVQLLQHVQSQVPQVAQRVSVDQQRQQQVWSDFYGRYPQLNDPAIIPVVVMIAGEVAKRKGSSDWSPGLRDEIAREVFTKLRWQLPAVDRQQPPAQVPAGARPSGVAQPADEQQRLMQDLIM